MEAFKIKRKALTFIEVMIAALLLAVILLPMFNFLTNSVKDTERIYTEVIAISRAKLVMDALLFQIPWRAIREGNPCRFEDPQKEENALSLMSKVIPEMMGEGSVISSSEGKYTGEGLYKSEKGFWFRTRVKVVDLDEESLGSQKISFTIGMPGGDYKEFKISELAPKDFDGKYNLVKKIVVQVKWSLIKGREPNEDSHAKSIFLVGFKSNLEG